MARRGDGIGLEITSGVVRGVRLDQDEPGRVAAVCEIPIARFDDNAVVFDALVRARARLGEEQLPTRVAWFPVGSTLQRLDVTGLTAPELNTLRHQLADDTGVTSTMLVDIDARRWMLALRWDHTRVWWIEDLLERAGFVVVTIEPSPLALGRVLGASVTVVRRDASQDRSWAGVFDPFPIAAVCVDAGDRHHPSIACSSEAPGVSDLGMALSASELSRQVVRVATDTLANVAPSRELDANLRVLDEPYPPFPAHDVRAPQRVGVALGAAVGAAGLAGGLRAVDVLTSVRQVPEASPRPWAVERLSDAPPPVQRRRPPWWSRAIMLVRSWFRRAGREY